MLCARGRAPELQHRQTAPEGQRALGRHGHGGDVTWVRYEDGRLTKASKSWAAWRASLITTWDITGPRSTDHFLSPPDSSAKGNLAGCSQLAFRAVRLGQGTENFKFNGKILTKVDRYHVKTS